MRFSRQKILWRRALDWLTTYHPLVIAVTGTYGKSTAAAAIEKVVAGHHTVRWTPQSTPGPLAVPLSILGLSENPTTMSWYRALTHSFAREIVAPEPEVLILEITAHQPGDIDWLANRLSPDITVVTNVGTANTELFGSRENIAHELSSLVVTTKREGFVIVNNDDVATRGMPTLSPAAAISFGTTAGSDIQLTRANRRREGGFALEVKTHREMAELLVPGVIARHQLHSLLAALAVGHALKIPLKTAAKALHNFEPLTGRTSLMTGRNDSRIIDDSANATPESMQQALETLGALPCLSGRQASCRRIAVIGDISRLGREAEKIHRHLGRSAAQVADMVIAVGENMRWAGMEALQAGADVHHFDSPLDAGKWLAEYLVSDDTILVSGGRDMQMSRVVERLQ
jgi:UDP-N-acetylmuramoyl-tripeptide--D-alanyl-D-alanine ligase